jgi:hypothetical protein
MNVSSPQAPPKPPDALPPPLSDDDRRRAELRAKLGLALIVLGIAGILWGVFHLLDALPKPESLDFAHRTTDFENRKVVHDEFLPTVWRALLGLAVALFGGHTRRKAQHDLGRGD